MAGRIGLGPPGDPMEIAYRHRLISILTRLAIISAVLLFRDATGQTQPIPQIPAATPTLSWEPMPDALRSEIKRLVIVASDKAARESITGSYEKTTPGLVGGINEGANLGTMSTEIGGVNVSVPVPILAVPGAVYGGLSGTMKREIQEFRDELTEELANAESHPLTNTSLALDVHHNLSRLPQLDTKLIASSVVIAEPTDAVLYVGFSDISIHVEDKEAILTVSALAELRRSSDGTILYKRMMQYLDRDTLGNWNRDDRALWRDYSNYAAHYLGRELAAEAFSRILVAHELQPAETGTARRDRKDGRRFNTKVSKPEIAWSFALPEDGENGSSSAGVAESAITYDLEIYDEHRLVYARTRLPEPMHIIADELDPCRLYRWSVRPVFDDGTKITYFEWMRLESDPEGNPKGRNGLVGRNASIAPAYTQDFALLGFKCRR
jgi:hypothetical protein